MTVRRPHVEQDDLHQTADVHMVILLLQSQRTLKLSEAAAMMKVDELLAQLKGERLKSLELEERLQSSSVSRMKMEQVHTHLKNTSRNTEMNHLEYLLLRVTKHRLQQTIHFSFKLRLNYVNITKNMDLIQILDVNEACVDFTFQTDAVGLEPHGGRQ